MEFISQFLGLDPRATFIVIMVAVFTVFVLVVMWLSSKLRDANLNRDLRTRGDDESVKEEEDEEEEPEDRFFTIESYRLPNDWDENFSIIVDRQTKVQYLNFGECGITPLIDSNGKPILYEDEYADEEEPE